MAFRIIENRNDKTTIAILGFEPLTMEYNQTKKSPRRSIKQLPIFNHPFLTRGSKKTRHFG